jgi:FKBP-type peptidyl-prolyl cis-trans isomerase
MTSRASRHVRFALSSVVIVAAGLAAAGCSKAPPEPDENGYHPVTAPPLPPPPTKLDTVDVKVGTGAEAKSGDTVLVNYTGTLMDGTQFDSSIGKEPFKFQIGHGDVIKGWDLGVPGMKVGGKRTLTIPPDLGYGANGSPPKIPGNAGLKFDVELVSILPKS